MSLTNEIRELIDQTRILAGSGIGVEFLNIKRRVYEQAHARGGISSMEPARVILGYIDEVNKRLAKYTAEIKLILDVSGSTLSFEERAGLEKQFSDATEVLFALIDRESSSLPESVIDRATIARQCSDKAAGCQTELKRVFKIMLLAYSKTQHPAGATNNFYGDNARVNNGGVDQSQNAVQHSPPPLGVQPLTTEEQELLLHARVKGELQVHQIEGTGQWVRSGKHDFFDQTDRAFNARYLDALHRLMRSGLASHYGGILYRLTGYGFEAARSLEQPNTQSKTVGDSSKASTDVFSAGDRKAVSDVRFQTREMLKKVAVLDEWIFVKGIFTGKQTIRESLIDVKNYWRSHEHLLARTLGVDSTLYRALKGAYEIAILNEDQNPPDGRGVWLGVTQDNLLGYKIGQAFENTYHRLDKILSDSDRGY